MFSLLAFWMSDLTCTDQSSEIHYKQRINVNKRTLCTIIVTAPQRFADNWFILLGLAGYDCGATIIRNLVNKSLIIDLLSSAPSITPCTQALFIWFLNNNFSQFVCHQAQKTQSISNQNNSMECGVGQSFLLWGRTSFQFELGSQLTPQSLNATTIKVFRLQNTFLMDQTFYSWGTEHLTSSFAMVRVTAVCKWHT